MLKINCIFCHFLFLSYIWDCSSCRRWIWDIHLQAFLHQVQPISQRTDSRETVISNNQFWWTIDFNITDLDVRSWVFK